MGDESRLRGHTAKSARLPEIASIKSAEQPAQLEQPSVLAAFAALLAPFIADYLAAAPAAAPELVSPYMMIEEAATYMRCKRHRIDALLCQQRLTRYKDGSRVLLLRAEIDAHLVT